MTIGFYVQSLGDPAIGPISSCIAESLHTKAIDDAVIFYDEVAPMNTQVPCSLQNACNLWSFSGSLFIHNIELINKANNIVNDIDIYYYLGLEKINTLAILHLMPSIKGVVCASKDALEQFKRITNSDNSTVIENYKNIASVTT